VDSPEFPELNKVLAEIAGKYGVSKTAIAIAWILIKDHHIRLHNNSFLQVKCRLTFCRMDSGIFISETEKNIRY
jgi:predicted oxidoreductase